jgi:N-acetylglutamate synthase-like GNAT family acetyltransferase
MYEDQIKQFIEQVESRNLMYLQHKSAYLDMGPHMSLYARYGWYRTDTIEHCKTFVIATVEVVQSRIHQGMFKQLLADALTVAFDYGLSVAVESVNNTDLEAYLKRIGFKLVFGTPNSYTLHPIKQGLP